MAYLVSESRLEEDSIIEIEAEAVVQRIFGDGVGLYELMETMEKQARDNLDNRLVRLTESDEIGAVKLVREIRAMMKSAAEACVRGNYAE